MDTLFVPLVTPFLLEHWYTCYLWLSFLLTWPLCILCTCFCPFIVPSLPVPSLPVPTCAYTACIPVAALVGLLLDGILETSGWKLAYRPGLDTFINWKLAGACSS